MWCRLCLRDLREIREVTDPAAKEAFERYMHGLREAVPVVSRKDDARIEALEVALRTVPDFLFPILSYDMRWPAGRTAKPAS